MSHVVATIYCNVYRMEFSVKKKIIISIIFQKGEQRGNIIIIKKQKHTHTLSNIHSHRSSRQRILLREIHKLFDWH